MFLKFGSALAIAACLLASPVLAQAAGTSARTVFQASFYATFAPSNALDIVNRTPGFSLESGDIEVRGFGQAAGNVVINGQRPSSKSETLDDVLARIPASRVARVEIGSGDLFGSEFAGKPQVLNLVLIESGGVAGTTELEVRRIFTGRLFPEASASGLTKRGASTFNVAAGYDNDANGEEGSDTLRSLPAGNLVEFRRKLNRITDTDGYASASWAYAGADNRTAHLNGKASDARFALTQANGVFPKGGTIRNDALTQRYKTREFEIGGDVTRPLAGGGIKLIGLATRRNRDNRDVSINRIQSQVTGGFAQDVDDRREETVARLVWNRGNLAGWSVETGAEGVLNKLDSQVDFFSIDASGARTRIDLPVDSATVKEYRGELFVNAGRPLTPELRLDLGLTYETSRLTVRGDATAERSLNFMKPKATFDWRPGNGWHAQLALSRTVAQLLFEDFIGEAELANDRVTGGNAELVPQRAWEVLATVEHPILGDGLIKIEAGYNQISLVQDRVPTPEGFDAPGNLGDGRLFSLKGTLDAPLARLGIKGGRLSGYVSLIDTSVEDPYTLRNRAFSNYSRLAWEANFRQDLGSFAWGVSLNGNARRPTFRQNELDTYYSSNPYVSAFAEYRPSASATLTFGVDNLSDDRATRSRIFFAPDRRTAQPNLSEFRERSQHVIPYLRLKKNFG